MDSTVAILFVVEIDSVAYKLGLGEQARSRTESAGRVELDDAQLAFLARMRTTFLNITLFGIVLILRTSTSLTDPRTMMPFLLFALGNAAFPPQYGNGAGATTPASMCKHIATTLAAAFAGFVIFMLVFLAMMV